MTDNCPSCGTSLLGRPVPEGSRGLYGEGTHFRREIGVQVPEVFDGVLYWLCPDCGFAWPRRFEGNPKRQAQSGDAAQERNERGGMLRFEKR